MTKHIRADILIAPKVYFKYQWYLNNGLITLTAFDLLCKKIMQKVLVIRS